MDIKAAALQKKETSHLIFWLKEGPNTFGSHPRNNFVFPEASIAFHAGILFLKKNTVLIRAAESANITHQKAPIDNRLIYSGGTSLPLESEHLEFKIINQDGRLGLEVKER